MASSFRDSNGSSRLGTGDAQTPTPMSRAICATLYVLFRSHLLPSFIQREHAVRAAGVGDVVGLVVVERAREPAAAFALVGFQPLHCAGNGRVGRLHARLQEDVGGEAGAVAVARGVRVVRRLGLVAAMVVAERGETPAAVLVLLLAERG